MNHAPALKSAFLWIALFLLLWFSAGCSEVLILPPNELLQESTPSGKKPPDKPIKAKTCILVGTPSPLYFGLTKPNHIRTRKVEIQNQGMGNCTLTRSLIKHIKPSAGHAFYLTSQNAYPIILYPGGVLTLSVDFQPYRVGTTHQGTLQVETQKSGKLWIGLLGESMEADCLEVQPKPLLFGKVTKSCKDEHKTFTLKHKQSKFCPRTFSITSLQLHTQTTEFKLAHTLKLPVVVGWGSSYTLRVSYRPVDLGMDKGFVAIHTDLQGKGPYEGHFKGEGIQASRHKDSFRQNQEFTKVDILFVVDNSGSMLGDQKNLARNFFNFIYWASKKAVDYQIGVITTDTSCLVGNPNIITPKTKDVVSTFQKNVKVGISGSYTEKAFQMAKEALAYKRNTCNKGFLRPDANLSIIFVSDEREQSFGSIADYIQFFSSLKPKKDTDNIRVSAVAGRGFHRFEAVTKHFKGIFADITKHNWSDSLNRLGMLSFGFKTQFRLKRTPIPGSIKVKVNGQEALMSTTKGWYYEASTNAVHFTPNQIPPANGLIEITYRVKCLK